MYSFNDLILAASSQHGWVRRWLVFVPSLAVLLSSLHNLLTLFFSIFPPVEELYRVLDSSPERLAVAFFFIPRKVLIDNPAEGGGTGG